MTQDTAPRCYFGCDGRLNYTLLELPDGVTPRLCEDHAVSWRFYRALLLQGDKGALDWPTDFYPWADKMRKEMEKAIADAAQRVEETRAPDTEIMALEAVIGAWYTVPSGEIERCYAIRNRGRGVQVGFVGADSSADPDDIRWLQGKTSILVTEEPVSVEVRAARDALATVGKTEKDLSIPELEAMAKDAEARVEAGGHDGADIEEAIAIGKALEEARAAERRLISPTSFDEDMDLQAGGPSMTAEQIVASMSEEEIESVRHALAQLSPAAVKSIESAMDGVKDLPPASLWTPRTAVYHKSLHIDWRTPKPIFDAQVARWGPFWLDAAATEENKLCEYYLDAETDALSVDWGVTPEIAAQYGRNIWLNHPYTKGEEACPIDRSLCTKKKCTERGYHADRRIASSGEWMAYARDQALKSKSGGKIVTLTGARIETQWWEDAVRIQPPEASAFISGRADPFGGPAAEFMNATPYHAATWLEFRWENLIVDVVEIKGRVDFDRGGNDGSAGFSSAIVTFYKPGQR